MTEQNPAIRFRSATPADRAEVSNLATQGTPGIRPNNEMIYYLSCTVLRRHLFLAESSGALVGMALCVPGLDDNCLWLHQLVVRPAFRGKGVGTSLMVHLHNVAMEEGWGSVQLMVRDDNPARKLYKVMGYRAVVYDEQLSMWHLTRDLV